MAGAGTAQLRPPDQVILQVEGLDIEYRSGRRRAASAAAGVSFDLAAGESLGLVGESGCGKSSIAKAIVGLAPISAGSVTVGGDDAVARRRKRAARQVQMVFQDPVSSLNPRRAVRDIVAEPLAIRGERRGSWKTRVDELLEEVGLDPEVVGNRRPSEFSGGQCQRISIARALMANPRVLICDEPVSSLDVAVQAQILQLLRDLRELHRLALLFIAHDLAVVKNVCDRVLVMYLGRTCEVVASDDLAVRPAHPYTAALLAAVPEPDPALRGQRSAPLTGEVPSPLDPPSGCRFRTRCPFATERCRTEVPEMRPIAANHFVACHHPLEDPVPNPADRPSGPKCG